MEFIDRVTHLHISQDYAKLDYHLPFDVLKETYARLPNESEYIVDCRTLDIEYLNNNLSELTGSAGSIDLLTNLYDHVHKDYFKNLTDYIYKILLFGFGELNSSGLSEKKRLDIMCV